MNNNNGRELDSKTDPLVDLSLTAEQAEQAKAGRGDERYVYVFIGTQP